MESVAALSLPKQEAKLPCFGGGEIDILKQGSCEKNGNEPKVLFNSSDEEEKLGTKRENLTQNKEICERKSEMRLKMKHEPPKIVLMKLNENEADS